MTETFSSTYNHLDELADLVTESNLSKPTFESIIFQLSPAEKRLFLFLCQHEQASTTEITHYCSISGISQIAKRINEKLRRDGDTRQVVSNRESYQDEYGLSGNTNIWELQ